MTEYVMHLILLLIITTILHLNNVLANDFFGYSNTEQRKWGKSHASCAGILQSPIRIESHSAIPLRMPALELIRYHDLLPEPLTLHNNGHSVSLNVGKPVADDPRAKYMPYIFGAKLKEEYVLEGLHFHWGENNNKGSEHTFNGIRYPMEMHIIHRNRKYASVKEALNYRDGLTVLGFFFQLRQRENKQLNDIVRALEHVEVFNSTYHFKKTFMLSNLLPPPEDMDQFYTYQGSLTTPPCSEAVTWILFPNPLPLSVFQMNKFRNLQRDERNSPLFDNYRQVQKKGARNVFVRVLRPRGIKYNESKTYSDWDWLQNESVKNEAIINEVIQ